MLLSDVISLLTQGPTSILISLFYSLSPSTFTSTYPKPHSTFLGLEMASRGCRRLSRDLSRWHVSPQPWGPLAVLETPELRHACMLSFVTPWTVAHIHVFISFKSYHQHHSISAYENPMHPFSVSAVLYL